MFGRFRWPVVRTCMRCKGVVIAAKPLCEKCERKGVRHGRV